MKKQILTIIIRWLANALGLWVSAKVGLLSFNNKIGNLLLAALILAVLNALIKPLIIIFTLPAIVFTLGFFLVVINGVIVWLLGLVYGQLNVESFWTAVLAGLIIGLVNYIITIVSEALIKKNE